MILYQNMANFIQKLNLSAKSKRGKVWAKKHKVWTLIILVAIIGGSYFTLKHFTDTSGAIKYVLARAKIDNIESSVSGTGYVSAENQIDVKSKVSGDVTYIVIKSGDKVFKGQLLAQVDSRDALLTLQNAQISYDKLVKPADQDDIEMAEEDILKSYNDSWNAISSVFLDMSNIISGVKEMLYGINGYLNDQNIRTLDDTALDYGKRSGVNFDKAKNLYEEAIVEYKSLNRSSPQSDIDRLMENTYNMVKQTADTLKDARNAINYISGQYPNYISSIGTTASLNINTWSAETNTALSSILSAENSVLTNKKILKDLKKGADALDIESEALALKQKQYAYGDYFIRAPFDGVIAKVGVKVGNPVSGATVATIVSNKNIAEIPLNEIDAVNVKIGKRVSLSFDAVPGLTLEGEVSEVDLVGIVSQGVVTYNIKVSFDSNIRVKSGMSISASIITDEKKGVITIPASAVKARGQEKYVETLDFSGATIQKPVIVGITNDTDIEIKSGLEKGEQVVVRTTSGTSKTTQAPSLFGGGGGSGNIRLR